MDSDHVNMIAHTTLYPLTPNPKDILAAFDEENFKNNFCGDVQVRGEYFLQSLMVYVDSDHVRHLMYNAIHQDQFAIPNQMLLNMDF